MNLQTYKTVKNYCKTDVSLLKKQHLRKIDLE